MRSQHVEFAHYILPEEIGLDPANAWAALHDPARAGAVLTEWWELAHAYSRTTEEPQPATGLAATPCQVGDKPGILITLPPPHEIGGVWFALIVLPPVGPPRCFLLEMASGNPRPADIPPDWPEPAGLHTTYIGERSPETSAYYNHGRGPAALTPHTAPEFIRRVARLMAGETLTENALPPATDSH